MYHIGEFLMFYSKKVVDYRFKKELSPDLIDEENTSSPSRKTHILAKLSKETAEMRSWHLAPIPVRPESQPTPRSRKVNTRTERIWEGI